MVFGLCFSRCICSILHPPLFSSGAIACSFILPWCWLWPWLYMTSGDQHLLRPGPPLRVFGSYSWEPLVSHGPSSSSWLGRNLVQKYLSRGLGSSDLLTLKARVAGGRDLWKLSGLGRQICSCNRFHLSEYLKMLVFSSPLVRDLPQEHGSSNPKIEKESVFSFDFKTGS